LVNSNFSGSVICLSPNIAATVNVEVLVIPSGLPLNTFSYEYRFSNVQEYGSPSIIPVINEKDL